MEAVPANMRAIDPDAPGGPEVLAVVERPVPRPGPGELLIRVAAAGVNRPDLMQREGGYPPPAGAPSILGLEVSGEVVARGAGAERYEVGSTVCALLAGGGYAEYAAVPEGQCLPIPRGVSIIDAAGLPETCFTVWGNLFHYARAAAGQSLLVHGGTSGIGTTAIQMAGARGLRVFATCGTEAKCQAARALGAELAINYRSEDFVASVRDATGGRGVDLVLDMVGGDYLPRNLRALAEEGRHISVAAQRGGEPQLPIAVMMRKRLVLTGSTLRPRSPQFKAQLADELRAEVWPLFASGAMRAVTHAVLPLAQAAEAHRILERGEHVGKVVLSMA